MIIGNENLKDLFPEFEDCIKENGLDLKIGRWSIPPIATIN